MDDNSYRASVFANKDVTERNEQALKEYGEGTRAMFRDMEVEQQRLANIVLTLKAQLEQQQGQLAILQAKVLGGGATGGD